MKIDEIKVGMTCYHSLVDINKGSRRSALDNVMTTNKLYVLDIKKNIVIASCNGGPAQTYKGTNYRKWSKDKPVEPKLSNRYKV